MKPVVSALMMVMVMAVMTVADPIGNLHRVKRQYSLTAPDESSDPCTAKYKAMSPTHTLCLPTDIAAKEVVLNQEMKDHILELHNNHRRAVQPTARNMRKLVWDKKLERTARQVAMRCVFDHDRNRNEPEWINVPVGQNIATGHSSWEAALERYFTEPERNNYSYGDVYKDGIGHYFQMAFAETARVGCAQAECPNVPHFRACNYAIRMDVGQNDDKPPYEKGAPCADCPNHCDTSKKLCDCGDKMCLYTGTLNLTNCQCMCTINRSGPDCSILCNNKKCENGGTLDMFTCKCSCPSGFTGNNCETACNSIVCQNGGTPNECGCSCPSPYAGDRCQEKCTTCSVKNSYPVSVGGECACRCKDGWFGSDCSKSCVNNDEAFCSAMLYVPSVTCDMPVMQSNCGGNCKDKLCNNPIAG